MSQYVESARRTLIAGGAIAEFLRVKASGGRLAVADADELGLGTIEVAAFADGQYVPVRLWSAQGTRKMVAAGPFAAFAKVFGAAGGLIDDVESGAEIGIALEASTDEGDIVEVAPCPKETPTS